MNWLEIYHVMMMELYDVSVLFLRCLREIEKWSWILILRKNEEKSGKMAAPESAIIHYYRDNSFFFYGTNSGHQNTHEVF